MKNKHEIKRRFRIELQKAGYSDTESDFLIEKGFGSDMQKKFPNGSWKTISGARVFINDSKVVAGLDGFNGHIDEAFKEKTSKPESKEIDKKENESKENHISSESDLRQMIKDGKDMSNMTIDRDVRSSLINKYGGKNKDMRSVHAKISQEVQEERSNSLKLSPEQDNFFSENKKAVNEQVKKDTGKTLVEILEDDLMGDEYAEAKKNAVEKLMSGKADKKESGKNETKKKK